MAVIVFRGGEVAKPHGFMKIIEVVLGIIIVALYRSSYSTTSLYPDVNVYLVSVGNDIVDPTMFVIMTFCIFLLYSLVMLICVMTDEASIKTLVECDMNLLGGIFYIAAGSLVINTYMNTILNFDNALACGSLAIIQGFVYLIDAGFAFKAKI